MNPRQFFPLSECAIDWVADVISERLGLKLVIEKRARSFVLRLKDADKFIEVVEGFAFEELSPDPVMSSWLPSREGYIDVIEGPIPAPGLLRGSRPLIQEHAQGITVRYDIVGLIYWALGRVEELCSAKFDEHGRFPSEASHAVRFGYLTRPFIDEWLEVLKQIAVRVWPGVQVRVDLKEIQPTHDVDRPSQYKFESWMTLAKMVRRKIVTGESFQEIITPFLLKLGSNKMLDPSDPFNTFDFIMTASEERGLQSHFFFLAGGSHPQFDAGYQLNSPLIGTLMRRIYARGHHIGLHPSYSSLDDDRQVPMELENLKHVFALLGIDQVVLGSRMHYLRFSYKELIDTISRLDIDFDSSLGYSDKIGFRAGTVKSFQSFDCVARKKLKLTIKPLILMDVVALQHFIYNSPSLMADQIQVDWHLMGMIENWKRVGGGFNFLWHNSELDTDLKRASYSKLMALLST